MAKPILWVTIYKKTWYGEIFRVISGQSQTSISQSRHGEPATPELVIWNLTKWKTYRHSRAIVISKKCRDFSSTTFRNEQRTCQKTLRDVFFYAKDRLLQCKTWHFRLRYAAFCILKCHTYHTKVAWFLYESGVFSHFRHYLLLHTFAAFHIMRCDIMSCRCTRIFAIFTTGIFLFWNVANIESTIFLKCKKFFCFTDNM